ncbi:MAG TPA: transglutaminase-like domain-containing protein, partial [Bacteroidales bacterium]|nr:transglutaminase-like domain-containing protein [Bacteroidales bacterium]
ENLVQVENDIQYIFEINNNEPQVYLIEKAKIIYLKNPAGMSPSQSLYSSIHNELIDYEVNSLIPNGKKYKKIPVKDYTEKMNMDGDSFYDDEKELMFTFPGVAEGMIMEVNAKYRIKEPRIIPTIFFAKNIPIYHTKIIIESDKNIDYDLISINNADEIFKFNTESNGNKTISTCIAPAIDKIKREEHEPGITYFEPHYIPRIKSCTIDGKKTDILEDINSLNSWYSSIINDIIEKPISTSMQTIADSITRNCESEFDKVKAIYYWLQSNIKYLDFEFGLGGYVPRDPDKTLNNRYGDCKDKTMLLFTLLKAKDIKSYPTWIGTYSRPYTYKQVPTPHTDNHMILTWVYEGKDYFLDGTSDYLNINYPSQFIQGKEALINISADEYRIEVVPKQLPEFSQGIDTVSLFINNRSLKGSGSYTLSGYHKIHLYYALRNRTKEEQKRNIEANLLKGNNKFVLDEDYTISEVENFDTTVTIDYSFVLDNYVQSVNDFMYVNLNLDKGWLDYKTNKDREHPVFLIYPTKTVNHYELSIPDNYYVDYLPETISYKSDFFNMEIKYMVNDGIIYYDEVTSVDIILVDGENLNHWNAYMDTLEKAFKQTILLKKDE